MRPFLRPKGLVISHQSLPGVLAGPILRHVDAHTVTVWLVTSCAEPPDITLEQTQPVATQVHTDTIMVGTHAFVHLLQVSPEQPLSPDTVYHYSLAFADTALQQQWQETAADLCYADQQAFSFCFQTRLSNVLHGSCRKPHHPVDDALQRVDTCIAEEFSAQQRRPDMLIMSGDQVYTDDVAGPTLQAIQQLSARLGLFDETLDGAVISKGSELVGHPHNFYEREQILPQTEVNSPLAKLFFSAKEKPIFTSVNAHNHLVSFAEIMAMYLLVWSDTPWQLVSLDASEVDRQYQAQFKTEQQALEQFVSSLQSVRRAMAHLPVYMIFDDHDVTDDWNLTRGWEEEVYGHPLSRRMVGNALMGYWLCQGWGNQPGVFTDILAQAQTVLTPEGLCHHDDFIDTLLEFEQWHYTLNTNPPVCVLDTRTRRWRSETNPNKPSGLMDWEALCEFQQDIIGKKAVIVVSAAPIYGVKFIETVQKMFTFFGQALTVDAENWMAHRGTAHVMLNIFRHFRTPPEFIILSGDVHYSFVYDVRLRFKRNSPHITQFTCSGLKNTFPDKLLKKLERLNRYLYSPDSILNVFTRRRNMSVTARPVPKQKAKTLLNQSAVGQLIIDADAEKVVCKALCADQQTIEFPAQQQD